MSYKPSSFQQKSMFNITSYIKKRYDEGNPISNDFFDGVDLSECSTKSFNVQLKDAKMTRDHQYNISESLVFNIISCLPFEYYQKHLSLKWAFAEKDNNKSIINYAISHRAFDFISAILDLGQKNLNHLDSFSDKDSYEYQCLIPLLNIGNHFSLISEEKESFKQFTSLFKTALQQYKILYEAKHSYYGIKSSFDANNWFIDYDLWTRSFFRFEKKESILHNILSDPLLFGVFEDVYKQYDRVGKKNELVNFQHMEIAFSYGNKKVVDLFQKELQFNVETLTNCFLQSIVKWSNKMKKILIRSKCFEISTKDDIIYINSMLNLVNKYHLNTASLPLHNILELFLINDTNISHQLNSLFPQIHTNKIINDFDIDSIFYINNKITLFSNQYNLELDHQKNFDTPLSYQLILMKGLSCHINPQKNVHIKDEVKKTINNYMLSHLNYFKDSQKNMNITEKNVCFNTFLLEQDLLDKEETPIKKIKI